VLTGSSSLILFIKLINYIALITDILNLRFLLKLTKITIMVEETPVVVGNADFVEHKSFMQLEDCGNNLD
jgi:hypothetical protein